VRGDTKRAFFLVKEGKQGRGSSDQRNSTKKKEIDAIPPFSAFTHNTRIEAGVVERFT